MQSLLYQLISAIRKTIWAVIVAYMLGLHNFYYGDDKTADNIVITIENNKEQDDSTPKD